MSCTDLIPVDPPHLYVGVVFLLLLHPVRQLRERGRKRGGRAGRAHPHQHRGWGRRSWGPRGRWGWGRAKAGWGRRGWRPAATGERWRRGRCYPSRERRGRRSTPAPRQRGWRWGRCTPAAPDSAAHHAAYITRHLQPITI